MKTHHKLSLIVRLNRLLKNDNREEEIFNEITEIATNITNSERSSLYVYDEILEELTTKIAQGTSTSIGVKLGTGIAGECARTRQVIIENDTGSNDYFLKDVDLQTGYTTKKILTVPIIGRFNELLGVLQILNKKEGDYTEEDSEVLELIADIAGSVIDDHKIKITLQKQVDEKTKELVKLNNNLERVVKEQIEEIRIKDKFLFEQSKKAALGDMIGIISHQLKQPLNAIGLVSQHLMETPLNELSDTYFKKTQNDVYNYVNFMSSTVDDFRNFFNPNKRKGKFSVKESIEKVTNLISIDLRKNKINIEISDHDIMINSFNSELQQIFLNLIINSKDAMIQNKSQKRDIYIDIDTEDCFCEISFRDTAGGIPEEYMDKIFDQYFSTKGDKGTGLGLYMIKMLIEDLGGTIAVKNSNDGAIFNIRLPLKA